MTRSRIFQEKGYRWTQSWISVKNGSIWTGDVVLTEDFNNEIDEITSCLKVRLMIKMLRGSRFKEEKENEV